MTKLGLSVSNKCWARVKGVLDKLIALFIVVVYSLNLIRLASSFLQLSKIVTELCAKIPIFVTLFVY